MSRINQSAYKREFFCIKVDTQPVSDLETSSFLQGQGNQMRRLTPKSRKRAVSGQKLTGHPSSSRERAAEAETASISVVLKPFFSSILTPEIVVPPGEQT